MYPVRIGASAERDLPVGFEFHESQTEGLGQYFLDSLFSAIDALTLHAGLHARPLAGLYRSLSGRLPFAIDYDFDGHAAIVLAVLDCRRNPRSIQSALGIRAANKK